MILYQKIHITYSQVKDEFGENTVEILKNAAKATPEV